MATKRKQRAVTEAELVRQAERAGLGVEAEVDCQDESVMPEEARNLGLWLQYQMARWLVRTGRRGCWYINATMGRRKLKTISWSCTVCGGDREQDHGACRISTQIDDIATVQQEILDEIRDFKTKLWPELMELLHAMKRR